MLPHVVAFQLRWKWKNDNWIQIILPSEWKCLLMIENSRVENQPTLFLSTQRLNCDGHYFPIRVDHRISRIPLFNWSIPRKVMRVLLSKGPIHCLVYLCAIGTRASKNTQFTTENIKENVIHRYDRQYLVYWIILEN